MDTDRVDDGRAPIRYEDVDCAGCGTAFIGEVGQPFPRECDTCLGEKIAAQLEVFVRARGHTIR